MRWLHLIAIALAGAAAASACDDGATPSACTNIPAGGCPLSYGKACDDPACVATYACLPGNRWELRQTCPGRDAGPAPDGGAGPDAAGPRDASLDVEGAYGGPGCLDLQPPDCTLGVAASCSSGCCGCEDLFVCRDGGWNLWGSCGEGGITPN